MYSNIEHFSNPIPTSESTFLCLAAMEFDRHDADHVWAESTLDHNDVWRLDPDNEETPDDDAEEEEFEEEETEPTELEA